MTITVDLPDDIESNLDALARHYGSREAALTELVRGAFEELEDELHDEQATDPPAEKQDKDLQYWLARFRERATSCPYPVDDSRERIY